MDGNLTGELLNKWNEGENLSNNELCIVINDLVQMRRFFLKQKERIICGYLIRELVSLQQMAENREIPKNNYLTI